VMTGWCLGGVWFVDTPSSQPQWHASIEQIRVIAYEYAAVVYNWLKGWL